MSIRWQVFRGSNKMLLFSVKRRSSWFNTKFDVFLASNTNETCCDFNVKASEKSCEIYRRDTLIARLIHEYKLFGKDTFRVVICPQVDYAFIVALIVLFNEINREGSNLNTLN
ncbi:hypothetical protein HPP92_007417 [Vanilla planifolia]|uniref:Uncharacterized protein n=1 Tax=Vanilla planifolia TaxID=51239 RepID=A0A835RCW9_VANPL|nr:hypothetical protein HPP92_007575 [Vanilla planifolia]KAG0490554.1 hypothetical protein HPP92_007417 [Vanilla planifolia]